MHTANPFRWINIAAYIAMVVMNALATLLPLNDVSTRELSDRYPVLVTPAGYVFSIWSLIYLLLLFYLIYQARPATTSRPAVLAIGGWFALSCLLNLSWIVVWHYGYLTLSVFVMIALLLTLIRIYTVIRGKGSPSTSTPSSDTSPTTADRVFVWLPFSIYLGWISVATIVNVSVWLYDAQWSGWGLSEATWAIILLLIATALATFVGWMHRDPAFMLVFPWAFIGIAVKQQPVAAAVATTAWICALLVLVLAVVVAFKAYRNLKW